MKKRNEKKSNKKVGNKRTSTKAKSKKVRSTRKGNSKKSAKTGRSSKHKNVGRGKRSGSTGLQKLSAKERSIYRAFETLLILDEKADKRNAAKVTKKRSDNLFIISLPARSFQNKVKSLLAADFTSIDKYLKSRPIEPLHTFVTLKIKKPGERGYFFNGRKSPADMVVNTENTREFAINVLTSYNNDMADLIDEQYDEQVKVYNVSSLSIRFLFLQK